jgi:hypothetical protein
LVTNPSIEREFVTQPYGLDAVHGDPLAVHLDNRDPLAIPALELGHARDVDLVDGETELGRESPELVPRPLAQVAVLRDEECDGRAQGYSPRIVLASATRETASP